MGAHTVQSSNVKINCGSTQALDDMVLGLILGLLCERSCRFQWNHPWSLASGAGATCGGFPGTSAHEGWASPRRVFWPRDAQRLKPFASPPRQRRHERAASGWGNETQKRSEEKGEMRMLAVQSAECMPACVFSRVSPHSQKHEATG